MPFEIKPMKWYEKENVGHGLGTYQVLDDPATGQWRWERRHHGLFEEMLGFPSRDAAKTSAEEWDRQLVQEFLTPLTVKPLEWHACPPNVYHDGARLVFQAISAIGVLTVVDCGDWIGWFARSSLVADTSEAFPTVAAAQAACEAFYRDYVFSHLVPEQRCSTSSR